MFCPHCGTDIPDGSRQCPLCHLAIAGDIYNTTAGQAKRPISTKKILTIVVSVIVMVAAFSIGYAVARGHDTFITVEVYTDSKTAIDVVVYVDNQKVMSTDDLTSGYYFTNTTPIVYNMSFFDKMDLVYIKAKSHTSQNTDETYLVVYPGGRQVATLWV